MNIIVIDAETYFDDEYSLSKLTTEHYCRDPRFEVHGWGVKWNDGPPIWVGPGAFHGIEWQERLRNGVVLAHHAQFDLFILNHIYDIRPRFILDTLSMARLVVGNHLSVGLEALAKHYDLQAKTIDYKSFKGKHFNELTFEEQYMLEDGCLRDVGITWDLFNILMQSFPDEELKVIDTTVRMFTEPVLQGDVELLGKVWMDEERRKRNALEELGVTEADLQSSEHFAALLRDAGVEPDTKPSPRTAGEIYCFAKTDDFMKNLIEEDSQAGMLARARLGIKSTLNQTRAERLGWMAVRGK